MAMTFKPKKQQIHVPGFGVVQKEDFNQEHFAVLMKRAGGSQEKKDAFIKQHLEVASYGDQELFEESEAAKEAELLAAKKAEDKKRKAEEKAAKEAKEKADKEEAELLAQLEAEELAKKKQSENAE
jgi:hypothetical protein